MENITIQNGQPVRPHNRLPGRSFRHELMALLEKMEVGQFVQIGEVDRIATVRHYLSQRNKLGDKRFVTETDWPCESPEDIYDFLYDFRIYRVALNPNR